MKCIDVLRLRVLSFSIIGLLSFLNTALCQQIKLDPNKSISQYNISFFSKEQGLPGKGALAVTQTKDGYLWFATYNGLARFDGVDLLLFSGTTIPAIKNNSITCFFEDKDSTLWIGSFGGLIEYNNNQWKSYTEHDGLPSSIIETILRDRYGRLWLGTSNGICYLEDGKITVNNIPEQLRKVTIKFIAEDTKGILWIATQENGLFYYKNSVFTDFCKENHLEISEIKAICEDNRGNIWIGTNKGLYKYHKDLPIVVYTKNDGLPSDNIKVIYEDEQNILWIGTDIGLVRYYNGEFNSYINSTEFDKHDVTGILEDFEGNLWVSSYDYGVYCVKGSKFTSYTDMEGLNAKIVYSIIEEEDKSLLIGTKDGIFNYNHKEFSEFDKNLSLPSNSIRDLLRDSKGNLWICTNKGLVRYKEGHIKLFTTDDGLSDNYVRLAFEDKDGVLWFGTKKGLNMYSNGKFTYYTRKDGLSNDFILTIFQNSSGYIWIGTRDGLNIIDDSGFKVFTEKDGLAGNTVFKIHEDKEGVIWVCCNGGLSRHKNNKLSIVSSGNRFFSNSIFQILEDNNGMFWCTCSNGVFTVSRDELNKTVDNEISQLYVKLFDSDDGMKESQCVANSKNCITSDGRLWFATYNGITSIHPDSIPVNNIPPITKIERITVDNQDKELKNEIILEPDCRRIEIKFTGLSFASPEHVHLEFMLQGFDREWVNASENRIALYTNLSPGEYLFKVRSCNNDGIWNKAPAELIITKKAFFYQTIWFYIVIVIVFLILVGLVYYWRMSAITRKKDELEKLVKIRTFEIEQQREEIQSQAENLAITNEEVVAQNSEITQQKEEIQAQAEQLAEANSELEKLSIVASETNNAVVITGSDGKIEWVNKGFVMLYGYSLEEFTALKGDNLIDASDNPDIKQVIRRCIDDKQPVIYSVQSESKKSEKLWTQTSLTPILDSEGNIYKLVAIDSDISKIKEAELMIQYEKEKSDKLLLNILPVETAEELKMTGVATPKSYDSVSVLFTDFKGFTKLCEGLTPKELVAELHSYFAKFDTIVDKYRIEKIKTIGDSYMCVGGLLTDDKTHATRTILAGLEIQGFIEELEQNNSDKEAWPLRLGIHSGEVITGVVGEKKFAYDIWGDTVNIASRMESSGEIGRVNVSQDTYELAENFFDFEFRGKVEAKNKGKINMYFVLRIKPEYSADAKGNLPNESLLQLINI